MNERKEVFILSYGCDLDHNNIAFLVKERLMPFSDWYSRKSPKETDICVRYEAFDINLTKHKQLYYAYSFYINKTRLEAFMHSLSKLKGNHVYLNPRVRGHIEATIDSLDYTGRVYENLEDGEDLIFVDEESINNIKLRERLLSLPSELQVLKIPKNKSFEERNLLFANWIIGITPEIKKE